MNAGDGPRSYVQNSSYQRGVIDVSKPIIEEEIAAKLDVPTSSNILIADFGCSTGHNSFPAMQFIAHAIIIKQSQLTGSKNIPEIHAFFNDIVTNDYNTLFTSLPPERLYHAVGLPGPFHTRLLPRSSLHFAYSSWSLHWLTQPPKAANENRIFYAKDRKEVCDAYLDQYSSDMGAFLKCRASEIVTGGMMALLIPGDPEFWDPDTEYTLTSDLNLFGSCLVDMAKKGRIREAKLESFNLPFYFATPKQLKSILEKSRSLFNIERMEILSDHPGKQSLTSVGARASFFRAALERLLIDHFESGIDIDQLFEMYAKKLEVSPAFSNPENDKSIVILAVLKRMASD